MSAWTEYSEADFDARKAPRRAARKAAEAAAAGQGGLFHVALPVVPVKTGPLSEQLPGQGDLFGDDVTETK